MVLTVSFVLSSVSRVFVTVPGVKRQLHRRVNASIGASGPHDFTVSFLRRQSVHRIPPNVRDDGQRLSYRGGTREALSVICPAG
jgi:hypothetical protein